MREPIEAGPYLLGAAGAAYLAMWLGEEVAAGLVAAVAVTYGVVGLTYAVATEGGEP